MAKVVLFIAANEVYILLKTLLHTANKESVLISNKIVLLQRFTAVSRLLILLKSLEVAARMLFIKTNSVVGLNEQCCWIY